MHIIIVGCGRVGSALADAGSRNGDDVVVIDKDPGTFRQLGTGFNGVTMRGGGCDQEQLRQAGIECCDAFVAATDSDSVNMMAAEIALRIYRVPHVVVPALRARSRAVDAGARAGVRQRRCTVRAGHPREAGPGRGRQDRGGRGRARGRASGERLTCS